MTRLSGPGVAMLTAAWLGATPAHAEDEPVEARQIALVVGVSTYANLPPELQIDSARTEAARVAAALEQGGGFDQVRLITDASATVANVTAVLKEQVAREVRWRDLFLVYFVGHGVGADFGDPRLLLYDTDPDALEATSMTVRDLATLLQKFVPASQYVVVTDAAHPGTLNGLSLFGPTGNDWPVLGNQSFVISSAGPRQVTRPGVFSKAFVEAVSGQADTNADNVVTGSELNNYLVVAVPAATGGAQLPTVQGTYTPALPIFTRPKPPEPVVAAVVPRVDKVKLNFLGAAAPAVSCAGGTPVTCDPSCYLWDVPATGCEVRLRAGEAELTAPLSLPHRGAYTCSVADGAVGCTSPPAP